MFNKGYKMATLEEMQAHLKVLQDKHDSTYQYSDDHRVYCKGRDQWQEICFLQENIDRLIACGVSVVKEQTQ